MCNKNSFRLRLNNEIETLQLSLRERAFQILALKLLKVFDSRGTLRSWHPRVLCSWILSFLKYNHNNNLLNFEALIRKTFISRLTDIIKVLIDNRVAREKIWNYWYSKFSNLYWVVIALYILYFIPVSYPEVRGTADVDGGA